VTVNESEIVLISKSSSDEDRIAARNDAKGNEYEIKIRARRTSVCEQADETDGGRENYCKVRMMLLEGRSSGSFKCDRPE